MENRNRMVNQQERPLFLLMVHAWPRQFHLLWKLLERQDAYYVVHYDAKASLPIKTLVRWLTNGHRNAAVLPTRPIHWGGWSQVQVQLDAMALAVRRGWSWSHYIGLSGQCLPIKPLQHFRSFLQKSGSCSFLELKDPANRESGLRWFDPWTGMEDTSYRVEYAYDESARAPGPRLCGRGPVRLSNQRMPWPQDIQLRGGASWVVLHRNHCQHLLTSPAAARIKELLRHSANPDEIFFQTALYNSPFTSEVNDQLLWEIDWVRGAPYTWSASDLDALRQSPAFFARKFDLASARKIISRFQTDLTLS